MDFITFVPIKNSACYKIKVREFKKNKEKFSNLFEPFVILIQTHGPNDLPNFKPNFAHYLNTLSDEETYINASLMRNQMAGIIHLLKELGFEEKDYSETGAARTTTFSLSKLCVDPDSAWDFSNIISVFPDIEVDYVPQLIIPYEYLPERLHHWYDRDSNLLTDDVKEKIKSRGGVLVAKSAKQQNESSDIAWRLSISPMDLFTKDVYSGCNVIEVLVILKDLRNVGLSKYPKNDLSSYYLNPFTPRIVFKKPYFF